jgi:cyclic beta-1,2-glucan synthetase
VGRNGLSQQRGSNGELELLGIELLEDHARRLGDELKVTKRRSTNDRAHLRRLDEHASVLRDVYGGLADDARRGTVTPAAEWLLDNFHLVSAATRDIYHDLPPSFFRRLPQVLQGDGAELPRVHLLALELIRTSSGSLDAQRLHRFVSSFQSVTPLTMGELWAWPSALKLALVEHLRFRADVLARDRAQQQLADRLAASLEGSSAAGPIPSDVRPAFVTRLLQRSREYGAGAASLRRDLEATLAARGEDVDEAIREEGRHQAAEQATMANLINSLRLIESFDWSEFFDGVSLVDQVLQRDPAGVYPRMDFRTRDRYRHAVEELADPTGEDQLHVALKAVEWARLSGTDDRATHVGYHLIGGGRRAFEESVDWVPTLGERLRRASFRHATGLYLGAIATGTFALTAASIAYALEGGWRSAALVVIAALTIIPASELTIQIVQRLIAQWIPPRRLPRFELDRIPASARTMVIVPTILDREEQVAEFLSHLEVQAVGNADPHLHFAVLSDFRDAGTETLARDVAILEAARAGIEALNRKHGNGRADRFFLFHRLRQWNDKEGRWMGWERKRGKIEEFNRLLRGATDTSFAVQVGDLSILPEVRYCITLDSDTRLPRDCARELVGIITHPLNRAVFDPRVGRVVEGYGILQPRVSVSYASAAGSLFARIYAGHTGVDPYTTAVSDTYQDLFGEGIFTGKALYDVDAFTSALEDSVPENALLSHDLFEGLHARVALVSDVELVDDYPSSVLTHARRQHRWIRGDWQILFWLFAFAPSRRGLRRNTLPLISRWKILDNLRRSLVAPSLVALAVAGWTILPGRPAFWTGVVVSVLASQLLPLVARLMTGPRRSQSIPVFLRDLARDTLTALAQIVLSITVLVYHAFDTLHAIGITLARLIVTRRRLLEWETAAVAAAKAAGLRGRQLLFRFAREMRASPILAIVTTVVVGVYNPAALPAAAPFLALWLLAPIIAYWVSVPIGARLRPLSDDELRLFRRTARATWRYFETFVRTEDSWLPPDNCQEDRNALRIARRTSPTNIGMALLSTLAAHDLGYISTEALVERLDHTLTTLEGLERHQGHFLNWYDTATLTPLHPRYVSTVDSGNLAAAFIALAQGLLHAIEKPQTTRQRLDGIADAADLLARTTASSRRDHSAHQALTATNRIARDVATSARADKPDTARLAALGQQLAGQSVATGAESLEPTDDIGYWMHAVATAIATLDAAPTASDDALRRLASRALRLADEMQFDMLYDRRRRIFTIGYRLADANGPGRADNSFYDLLASEARLASFVAIAKGDVPQHHWFHLGRLVTQVRGRATLISWGGTMFEYLMPLLLMRSFPGTLLSQSARGAVQRQIDYGRERGVTWGISESAYALKDRDGNYQYRAFGVPGLGFRRGLADELVIAPYATALAALVNPGAAAGNAERLARDGLLGGFGFYESVDYNPLESDDAEALTPPKKPRPATVRAFFAHHQGMSLVAMANVVLKDVFVERFHADPRMQATELLLQERVPRVAILSEARPAESAAVSLSTPSYAQRRFKSPHTASPHTQFLSNGRYTTAVTHTGGGFSTWRQLAVTRRRDDRTADCSAHYIYLRDPWSGRVWSPTYEPVCRPPLSFESIFELDKATYQLRDGDFETELQVTVSPEDDVEVRRLSIMNRGDHYREIAVTSYAEIVLAKPDDDLAHPAFGKLFLETEFDAQSAAILFTRRPRSAEEGAPVWGFHVLGVEQGLGGAVEWETDRSRFLGRGRTPAAPAALDGRALSGTTGAVLDPVAALRDRVRLAPGGFVRVTFTTGIAQGRDAALTLARKYRDASVAGRALAMAFTHAHVTLQHLGLTDDQAMLFDRVASRLFADDASCMSPGDLLRNHLKQSNLWGHGISGDLPIVLVRINETAYLPLARELLLAQEYWRLKGLRADVVILNEHPADYLDETQNYLTRLVQEPRFAGFRNTPGGVFLMRTDGMSDADRSLLGAVARVVLRGDMGGLAPQLDRRTPWIYPAGDVPPSAPLIPAAPADTPAEAPPYVLDNGFGGFSSDGREYIITLDGDRDTPLPWSNVLANAEFGTIVSSSGAAFTWAGNSRENRLTTFANDPLMDPTGEAIYLRDEDSGAVWGATPGPLPRRSDGGRWIVRHGAGVTRFEHAVAGVSQQLTVFVSPVDAVKIAMLTVTNTSPMRKRLSVFGYAEWCLGPPRTGERRFVVTERDPQTGALMARNAYNADVDGQAAFWHATQPAQAFTCDRGEFIGRNRTLQRPAALLRPQLLGRQGPGLDPCAALQLAIELEPGESRRVAFVLGHGSDATAASELAARYSALSQCEAALAAAEREWDAILGAIEVETPDDSFNLIVNRWLLYQTLSCRIWARSGPYQPGGAYGFRDQLQDVLAFVWTRPEIIREHLLRAASRQFREGDVQHWWHPPTGRGTRTRCSDDLVWLPFAAAAYVTRTGDYSVLDEVIPFLEAAPLEPQQQEVYNQPHVSDESGTLFDHAVHAIDHALTYGAHGLPLIGSGDWNDGMNRVGQEGRGESVWLGWFLVHVLNDFAPICERRGRNDLAERYRNDARWLVGMLELSWDGAWYRRAYFDDGTPLGSAQNDECKIDSLTQSWAVLSGVADPRRAARAMDSVRANLVRRDARLVLLLSPPFDRTTRDPGYIKGYVPGIRENGGQYTHAALWSVIALARLGLGDAAMELFHMINPINHTRTPEGVERYKVEPYVVAADVYAHPMHMGRGGWTWYTGSAGWMYQAAIEGLLGLRRSGCSLSIDPCIPPMWPGFKVTWRHGRTTYRIGVTNPERRSSGVRTATADGVPVPADAVPLKDDGGVHEIAVALGARVESDQATLNRRDEFSSRDR